MKRLTVMCDYTADCLWVDGAAVDWNYLIDEYNFPKDFKIIGIEVDRWQKMYENFNFWDPDKNPDQIYTTKEYHLFEELGYKIFRAVVKFVEIYNLPFEVEYFDEKTSKRFSLENNKLKEKDGTCI